MSHTATKRVLLCAVLAAGLLWDPMGLLRMTLLCALVHESGHVLAYMLCLRALSRCPARRGFPANRSFLFWRRGLLPTSL